MSAAAKRREEVLRVVVAETELASAFIGVGPPKPGWEGFRVFWASNVPDEQRWRAQEVAAMATGRRSGPRCFECFLRSQAAHRSGEPQLPWECESFGRWLVRDCGLGGAS